MGQDDRRPNQRARKTMQLQDVDAVLRDMRWVALQLSVTTAMAELAKMCDCFDVYLVTFRRLATAASYQAC